LAYTPGALETIVATGRELGYEPLAVIVLRAQPDYLESMYSELAKESLVPSIEDLIEQAARDGKFVPLNYTRAFELTYSAPIGRLEAIFGVGNVIARAYRPDRGLDFGYSDFLGVVSYVRGGLQLQNPGNPLPSANERVTLLQLLANIVRSRDATFALETFIREHFPHFDEADFARPFSLITRLDRLRLLSRFAADNAAINARFGIDIPFVLEGDAAMSDAAETRAQQHRALLAAVLQATENIPGRQQRVGTMRDDVLERKADLAKSRARS
jgi:hypothetical protein